MKQLIMAAIMFGAMTSPAFAQAIQGKIQTGSLPNEGPLLSGDTNSKPGCVYFFIGNVWYVITTDDSGYDIELANLQKAANIGSTLTFYNYGNYTCPDGNTYIHAGFVH